MQGKAQCIPIRTDLDQSVTFHVADDDELAGDEGTSGESVGDTLSM